jgi:DNA-directed RNA polymerase subunit RPC12/RpoP
MTELGRISKADLDRLPDMNPVDAALTLRDALARQPAVCTQCGARELVAPRPSTTYAGRCTICGAGRELVDYS